MAVTLDILTLGSAFGFYLAFLYFANKGEKNPSIIWIFPPLLLAAVFWILFFINVGLIGLIFGVDAFDLAHGRKFTSLPKLYGKSFS